MIRHLRTSVTIFPDRIMVRVICPSDGICTYSFDREDTPARAKVAALQDHAEDCSTSAPEAKVDMPARAGVSA